MIEEQLLYFLQYCDYLCNNKIILLNSCLFLFKIHRCVLNIFFSFLKKYKSICIIDQKFNQYI